MLSMSVFQLFIFHSLSNIVIQASPTPNSEILEPRNNHYKLKCSNAPTVVAGTFLNESDQDLLTVLPASGSSQPWYHYLWCTPGTQTYTFFNFGQGLQNSTPSTNQTYLVEEALAYGEATVQNIISQNGDGPISRLADNGWIVNPPNTSVQLYVQDFKKEKVTWSVLANALGGLANATYNYNHLYTPLLFQINDGKSGELGIGYAGVVDPTTGDCQYSVVPGQNYSCSAVADGTVVGGLA